jgi:glycosyltransferase involved in cell wall biosynthesis
MHIALGYCYFAHALGVHFEQALRDLGHRVTYVGLPHAERPGYGSEVSLTEIFTRLSPPPEVYLWIDPAGRYFPAGIEELPVPTVCYLVDVHLGTWRPHVARFFDAVFIAQRNYLELYRQAVRHHQLAWLPLAAADVFQPMDLPRIYDVAFVGSMTRAHRQTARARRLELLARHFSTNDFARGYTPAEASRIYNQARLVFNASINGDVNMRVFEGAACGALVLNDSSTNGLAELFDIGQELVLYEDDADLLEKAAHYLTHAAERERAAAAGQARAQRQHTYRHRAAQIMDVVTAPEFKRLAPLRTASPGARLEARLEVYTHLHMLDAIADATRTAGYHPLRRAWKILPCLARRILL